MTNIPVTVHMAAILAGSHQDVTYVRMVPTDPRVSNSVVTASRVPFVTKMTDLVPRDVRLAGNNLGVTAV